MILSDQKILEAMKEGNIIIEPFNTEQLNPNSYNIRLGNELLVYADELLDMKKKNKTERLIIPESGLILMPGIIYLGRTVERTTTKGYVPLLEGRSSVGRLGIYIHVTAGFGDNGFSGFWTLEIACIQPVRIYPNVAIGQIFYNTMDGKSERLYTGKYQDNNDIQGSMMYKDFIKSSDDWTSFFESKEGEQVSANKMKDEYYFNKVVQPHSKKSYKTLIDE